MTEAVVLATPRLRLREYADDDFAAVHAYASDPDVSRYMRWGPNREDDTRAFLRRSAAHRGERPRRDFELAITLGADDRLIGGCGLHVAEPEHRSAFIGYVLHRSHWGRGYASEAARALLAFGFERLALHRIYAVCDPANATSAHVLEKLGMRQEGHLREHRWEKGRWVDELLYAVLEREWRSKPDDTMSVS